MSVLLITVQEEQGPQRRGESKYKRDHGGAGDQLY